ncbi:LexA family transcriptional regulator [Apibacter adventoris]|uniref:Uncharacterized protein n=1 Tax=Apibacter adventoris TaxID=1679466 RepID=A0A2S8A719_9FLAO|nr:helix-turn-helix domain-containing protein [Apibacter adventoris]PQL90353.1 hypothetical protein C4S77_10665 [Apibacter adventoris]
MDKREIFNKLMIYLGFKKDVELARFLGISSQTLSNWKSRNTYKPQLIHKKCPEINIEWLLTGNGPMLNYKNSYFDIKKQKVNEPIYNRDSSNENLHNIPLYNLDTGLGLKDAIFNSKNIITNYIKIPNLSNCDGAIYVRNDSMYPLFKSGDIIAFKIVSKDNMFWGEMYLIEIVIDENNSFLTIRYLQKSELGKDSIKLTCENPQYEPQDIPLEKVKTLALIRASIRLY